MLTALEARLEISLERQGEQTPFDNPEVVPKIVHARMDVETIFEDEELAIIQALLRERQVLALLPDRAFFKRCCFTQATWPQDGPFECTSQTRSVSCQLTSRPCSD